MKKWLNIFLGVLLLIVNTEAFAAKKSKKPELKLAKLEAQQSYTSKSTYKFTRYTGLDGKMGSNLNIKPLAARAGSKLTVQFGKGVDQINHAFRHTDKLGLSKSLVQSSVETHFKTVSSQVVAGKPFNQIINIGEQRIQYTAFKLPNGTFNIGRIHGIK